MDEDADLGQRTTIERHQLAIFLVGSVGLGSLATALAAGSSTHPLILPLVAVAISFIPAALAVLLVRLGRNYGERVAVPLLAFGLSGAVLCLIAVTLVHVEGSQLGRPLEGTPVREQRR